MGHFQNLTDEQAKSLCALQDNAAGAYVTALGMDYEAKRDEINKAMTADMEHQLQELQNDIVRLAFCGLANADSRLVAQFITTYATGIALRAAAKVCGEPPQRSEWPTFNGEAVH